MTPLGADRTRMTREMPMRPLVDCPLAPRFSVGGQVRRKQGSIREDASREYPEPPRGRNVFRAAENSRGFFPRRGKLFSTAWKTGRRG